MAAVTGLYRYPVKGLSGEAMPAVELGPGEGFPRDRAFAFAHGNAPFDPAEPAWLPKTHFLMLMRNERLAALQTLFDDAARQLTVQRQGRIVARGRLDDPIGRKLLEQFFAAYLGDEVRGLPKLVQAPGHCFADCGAKVVSMISLASIRDLERVVRMPLHPLRFRANLYFEAAEPWAELGWPGREISVGRVRLKVIRPITRCAATDVDPETAARDTRIPAALQGNFGHIHMGVYAEVVGHGTVAIGDPLIAD